MTQENHHQSAHDHHDQHDHGGHHAHMLQDFKRRFWVSIILTVPVLLLSKMIQEWIGMEWT